MRYKGNKINYILFDAANTLIHKPQVFDKILYVLSKNGHYVDRKSLVIKHKILSEIINFPDSTSKDFYAMFNSELLLLLGILPSKHILDSIFSECSYLPWEAFDDSSVLSKISLPMGILSNFNKTLESKVSLMLSFQCSHIIVSANHLYRKPSEKFYQIAIEEINVEPCNVLYIGDSVKLDMAPASSIGMNTILLDRNDLFLNYQNRIRNFSELLTCLEDE